MDEISDLASVIVPFYSLHFLLLVFAFIDMNCLTHRCLTLDIY